MINFSKEKSILMNNAFLITGMALFLTQSLFAQQTINEVLTVNTSGVNTIRVENDVAGEEATIRFRSKSNDGLGWLHADIASYAFGSNTGFLGFKVPYNNSFGTGYDMIINHSGYVGIGTMAPTAIVQIERNSDSKSNMLSLVHKSSSGLLHSEWTFQQHTNGNLLINGSRGSWIFEKESDTYDNMISFVHKSSSGSVHSIWDFQQHTNGNLVLFNADHKSLFLNTGGSLGIGTTSTGSHRLAVEGSIGAREIKVEASGWSDFVFYEGYDLPPLEEIEKHIAEKGHLPEIPSEAEVTENGIYLGEMNAKLLQKIEELTLYLIEQNKELKAANQRINELRKEVSSLKNE